MPKKSRDSVRHDAAPRNEVLDLLRRWARDLAQDHSEVVRIGCFGSYARGDHTPASDLDVLIEVSSSHHGRWFDRPVDFSMPVNSPVGIELFIYTSAELDRMRANNSAWLKQIFSEMIWVFQGCGQGGEGTSEYLPG